MKLRCNQGDLAWVTYDEDSCAANIGRLVRVSGPVWLSRHYGGKPTWLIFPVDRRVWSVLDGKGGTYRVLITTKHRIEHPDAWLWPLRGSEDEQEFSVEKKESLQSHNAQFVGADVRAD